MSPLMRFLPPRDESLLPLSRRGWPGVLVVCGICVFAGAFGLALFKAGHTKSIAPPELTEIRIPSTADASLQPARLMIPTNTANRPLPLLVWLHTWSGDYRQNLDMPAAVRECREREWIFLQPNFRGPNNNPQACGSDLALQDLLDAVTFAQSRATVDSSRIYLLGESGGGHMAMLAASRFPGRWSAVSAWAGISDLIAWHDDSKRLGNSYWKDIESSCGGPPSPETRAEYRRRSPVTRLAHAAGLPIHLYAGIHDGHKGSVPIRQSLLAFNLLAETNGHTTKEFTDAQIDFMTNREQIAPDLVLAPSGSPAGKPVATQPTQPSISNPLLTTPDLQPATPTPDMTVLLHRTAGAAELTLFEGAHEMRVQSAFAWLATQSRPTSNPPPSK